MNILAIETSSECCSAALLVDNSCISKIQHAPRQQTQLLLPMIEALLLESGMVLAQMDGIAYSAGPGAFTGVRLGAAAAQGLALGLDLPVVPVSSLQTLARGVWRQHQQERIVIVNDARMQEIYAAAFIVQNAVFAPVVADVLLKPEALTLPEGRWFLAGNGLIYRTQLTVEDCGTDADIMPAAEDVAQLALPQFKQGRGLDPAAALPVYLRHSVWKKLPGR